MGDILDIDSATITVLVRVFAGVDFDVTLDGRQPNDSGGTPPVLEFSFKAVSPGTHAVEVRDVVGHAEDVEVTVVPAEAPDGPLDTALAEVALLSVEEGRATIRVTEFRTYNALPNATYSRLAVGEEVVVALQSAPAGGIDYGRRYLASLSLCLPGQLDGLSCAYEGWSAALYLLPMLSAE